MRKIYNTLLILTTPLWFKMDMEQIARWSYIAFVAIAIVMGLAVGYMAWSAVNDFEATPNGFADSSVKATNGWVLLILLILGVIVGLVSITVKEVTPFLIATIALIVASISNVWAPLSTIHSLLAYWSTGILNYIVAFAAPAAVIIAVKSVLVMAKEK
jgi:hypothetical protein